MRTPRVVARLFGRPSVHIDREREPALKFIEEHHEVWPTSYCGRGFWENPIGRMYRVASAGSAYLIGSVGNFVGEFSDIGDLEYALTRRPQMPITFELKR